MLVTLPYRSSANGHSLCETSSGLRSGAQDLPPNPLPEGRGKLSSVEDRLIDKKPRDIL